MRDDPERALNTFWGWAKQQEKLDAIDETATMSSISCSSRAIRRIKLIGLIGTVITGGLERRGPTK
jgi:hypothetical protein